MNFTVSLNRNGVPDDGLSPVINIWEAEAGGAQVATNEPMDLIATGAGGYTFDLVGADNTKNYYGEAYASTLPAGQQYAPCITHVQGEVSDILADTAVIDWADIDAIKAVTDTIDWTDIDTIKAEVTAIKAVTDTIDWTDIDNLTTLVTAVQGDVTFIKAIEGGKWEIDTVAEQMIFYEDDNITEVARFNLFRELIPASEGVTRRERVII